MNAKFRSYFYRVFQSKLVFTHSKSTMANTRKMCRICWKLKIKYSERRHWCRSGVVTVNFEKISHCSTTSIVDFKQINLAMATVCFWLAKTYILNIFLVMLQIKSLASYQKNPIKHFDAIVFVKYEICLHIGFDIYICQSQLLEHNSCCCTEIAMQLQLYIAIILLK